MIGQCIDSNVSTIVVIGITATQVPFVFRFLGAEVQMRRWFIGLLLLAAVLFSPVESGSRSPKQPRAVLPCSAIKYDPEKLQRPSPPGCSDVRFADGALIVVQYGRPKLRDPLTGRIREVFGSTVPWGEIWRAGANEATSFTTNTNLIVGNKPIPTGSYTIYVIPERRKPWTLIINKTTGQPAYPYPGKSSDVARIAMDTASQRNGVDQLTIEFAPGNDSTILTIAWENWKAAVTIVEAH